MVNELLIKPLTKIVLKIMIDYSSLFILGHESRPEYIKNILKNRDEVYKFINYLEDNKLDVKINKYICPYLVIDYDKLRSLRELKRDLPTLEQDENGFKRQ